MSTTEILKNKPVVLLYVLSGFFVANALTAEFMGVKIFSLESTFGFEPLSLKLFGVDGLGFNLSAGVLLWPMVFIMTDVINEYFGSRVVKFLSWMAVALILYAFIMIYWSIGLSPNDWWQYQSGLSTDATKSIANMDISYRKIMGQGLWIIMGSMVAFLVGQLVDVMVFHKIKAATGGKSIWMRATGSTLVSQFIDSFVVLFIAFYIGADWDIVRVIAIGIVNYSYKFLVAVVLTPVIYWIHNAIDNFVGPELAEKLKRDAAFSG
jgi:queuosine precursor transporter